MSDCHDNKKYKRELIDLLSRVSATLDSENIVYCGVFGTCLGAARSGDIIPWDDDIDIAVWRADFEKAIAVLNASNYQLFAEAHGFRSARIFNRVLSGDAAERKRAYVDLYVIDYAPRSIVCYLFNVLIYVGTTRILSRRTGQLGNAHPLLYFLADLLTFPLRLLHSETIENIARHFYISNKKTSLVKLSFDANRKRYPAKIFDNLIRKKFNATEIAIPKDYDEYLTLCYGDWRTPPKIEDRYSHAFDKAGLEWTVPLPKDAERAMK